MDIFELGNFTLTTGYTLPNAKLAYTTHGTLSAMKDNAILFTNFIGGTDQALEVFIGEDFALDPRKYFIILPGQFGNGFSSSPSNTPPPYDRGAFPPINVADDILAQHRLVTEHFGIQELQLVVGWSVGALQTYEWAVRFPQMVKRVAPTAGAPRPSAWTRLWLRNVIEEPITADPAWNNGFYEHASDLQAGARLQGHATALTVAPPEFFRGDGPRSLGFASVDDLLRGFFEAFWLSQDPNNVICQARKAARADPGEGGDLAAALGRIRTFVFAFAGDRMFPPQDCKSDAELIPNARFRELSTRSGHLSQYALFPEDRQAIDGAIREALAA